MFIASMAKKISYLYTKLDGNTFPVKPPSDNSLWQKDVRAHQISMVKFRTNGLRGKKALNRQRYQTICREPKL
jgi:hypothetical protein